MNVNVFKRTSDEWYPAYLIEGDARVSSLVEVSFVQTGPCPPSDGQWRVCVWGADDCGMEKDFKNKTDAWDCFVQVVSLEDVTQGQLKSLGFVRA